MYLTYLERRIESWSHPARSSFLLQPYCHLLTVLAYLEFFLICYLLEGSLTKLLSVNSVVCGRNLDRLTSQHGKQNKILQKSPKDRIRFPAI